LARARGHRGQPAYNGQETNERLELMMADSQSAQAKGAGELLHELMLKMIEFDAGDVPRIQHFIKVASFARTIGLGEGMDADTLLTLEAAAIVHDIGIHPAEEKYGSSNGKYQEELGPEPARQMLAEVGLDAERCERVAYLVGHHHTYTGIDGIDYQALVEADFLVNLFEDGASENAIRAAHDNVFRTATGKRLLKAIYFGE
jgi:uncharacterized protein